MKESTKNKSYLLTTNMPELIMLRKIFFFILFENINFKKFVLYFSFDIANFMGENCLNYNVDKDPYFKYE